MYDQTQTVFALSMMSNLGAGFKGTVAEIEAETYKAINAELSVQKPNTGTWTVVWGPAVYQAAHSNLADNVMVVFQAGNGAPTPGQIAVGIAGTNPYSGFDWILEDFLVTTTVPWEYGTNGNLNPRISLGTSIGMGILQALTPGPGFPGVGVTLRNFLGSAVKGSTPVTIAGHSLGGALSPAIALYLSDTKSEWNPTGSATVACVPSAGPTSGDRDFSLYYGTQLGSATTRLYNSLDVVPHAWQSSDLVQIPKLYSPAISATLELYALVLGAIGISAAGNYTQIDRTTRPLPGTVNQSLIKPGQSDCDNYTAQAFYQHVEAYFSLVGISSPSMVNRFRAILAEQISGTQNTVTRKQLVRERAAAQTA